MPWFKVDDSAHAHPKMRRAGKAAIGLWMMCGSYASAYLTDGIIPAETAAEGTPPQIAKLVTVGLWHPAGHGCPRCPQPTPGDYVMHDYLIYNFTRTRVLAERERAAEKKRNQRAGGTAPKPGAAANASRIEEESSPKTSRIGAESNPKNSRNPGESAGEDVLSPGDSHRPRAGAARPDPVVPPNGGTTTAGHAARSIGIPDRLQPLAKALSAHGLGAVAWDIRKHTDWERIRLQVERLGIDLMVESALGAANRRGKPDSVTAWIGRWESIQLADPEPASTPGGNVVRLHAAPDLPRPMSTTDQRVAGWLAVSQQLADEAKGQHG